LGRLKGAVLSQRESFSCRNTVNAHQPVTTWQLVELDCRSRRFRWGKCRLPELQRSPLHCGMSRGQLDFSRQHGCCRASASAKRLQRCHTGCRTTSAATSAADRRGRRCRFLLVRLPVGMGLRRVSSLPVAVGPVRGVATVVGRRGSACRRRRRATVTDSQRHCSRRVHWRRRYAIAQRR